MPKLITTIKPGPKGPFAVPDINEWHKNKMAEQITVSKTQAIVIGAITVLIFIAIFFYCKINGITS